MISNLRKTFFHLLNRNFRHQSTRRRYFKPVIIYCHLNKASLEEAAIYNSIDDKFSYTFRRKFINILPVNALYPCAKMNISKNELIRLLYLIPEITSVLSFIYKNTTYISCELLGYK